MPDWKDLYGSRCTAYDDEINIPGVVAGRWCGRTAVNGADRTPEETGWTGTLGSGARFEDFATIAGSEVSLRDGFYPLDGLPFERGKSDFTTFARQNPADAADVCCVCGGGYHGLGFGSEVLITTSTPAGSSSVCMNAVNHPFFPSEVSFSSLNKMDIAGITNPKAVSDDPNNNFMLGRIQYPQQAASDSSFLASNPSLFDLPGKALQVCWRPSPALCHKQHGGLSSAYVSGTSLISDSYCPPITSLESTADIPPSSLEDKLIFGVPIGVLFIKGPPFLGFNAHSDGVPSGSSFGLINASVICVIETGQVCKLELPNNGFGLSGSNQILIVNGECGDPLSTSWQIYGLGAGNPVQVISEPDPITGLADSVFRKYNLGEYEPSSRRLLGSGFTLPGDQIALCWSHRPSSGDPSVFALFIGTLRLVGPDPDNAFVCVVGNLNPTSCVLDLSTTGITTALPENSLIRVSWTSCGSVMMTTDDIAVVFSRVVYALDSSSNDYHAMVTVSLPVSADIRLGENDVSGTGLVGERIKVCWQREPDAVGYDLRSLPFLSSAGELLVRGPVVPKNNGVDFICIVSGTCQIRLNSVYASLKIKISADGHNWDLPAVKGDGSGLVADTPSDQYQISAIAFGDEGLNCGSDSPISTSLLLNAPNMMNPASSSIDLSKLQTNFLIFDAGFVTVPTRLMSLISDNDKNNIMVSHVDPFLGRKFRLCWAEDEEPDAIDSDGDIISNVVSSTSLSRFPVQVGFMTFLTALPPSTINDNNGQYHHLCFLGVSCIINVDGLDSLNNQESFSSLASSRSDKVVVVPVLNDLSSSSPPPCSQVNQLSEFLYRAPMDSVTAFSDLSVLASALAVAANVVRNNPGNDATSTMKTSITITPGDIGKFVLGVPLAVVASTDDLSVSDFVSSEHSAFLKFYFFSFYFVSGCMLGMGRFHNK
jgi:hypothetical protein